MRRPSSTIDARRLMVDGYELTDRVLDFAGVWEADELELRNIRKNVYRAALGLVLLVSISCAPPPVPPIVVPPPVLVVVLPGPLRHDLTAWQDEDVVCVHAPPATALYAHQRCLPMATIRSLILTLRSAE